MTGVPLVTRAPDLRSPNRVGGALIPNNPQPRPTVDDKAHTMDDLLNSLAGLNQALIDSKLRDLCREDWHQSYKIDTNADLATKKIRVDAQKETGGRPFNSLTILSVGGGNLVVSINGEEGLAVSAGDEWIDEAIWSFEAWSSSAVAGTARLRAGAYVGR